jgi:hypothetical protein
MYWHLSRHVAQGSGLFVPHPLLPAVTSQAQNTEQVHKQASTSDLLQVALALCNSAQQAAAQIKHKRVTFLEGYAGPLALKAAILSDLGSLQVRTAR